MKNIKTCKLCKKDKELCASHIIPKGLLKISKGNNSQLIALHNTKISPAVYDNVNWTEDLLCSECESHINLKFETTQIAILKRKKINHATRLTITEFNSEKFYLFWLSILWRASTSSLPIFDTVELPSELEEIIRSSLFEGSLGRHADALPELLQIGVSRWFWAENDTRGVITSFKKFTHNNSVCFVFLVSGLAIIYQISGKPCEPLPEGFSVVRKTFSFRMNKLFIGQSPILDEIIAAAQEAAKRNTNFLD